MQTSESARRSAESAAKEAAAQLERGSKWEQRYHDMEREKHRATEALQAAAAEAKAVGEREQVLLHRISLRERLTNVDWSRGADVIAELRAETQASTGLRVALSQEVQGAQDASLSTPFRQQQQQQQLGSNFHAGRMSVLSPGAMSASPVHGRGGLTADMGGVSGVSGGGGRLTAGGATQSRSPNTPGSSPAPASQPVGGTLGQRGTRWTPAAASGQ